MKKLTRIMLCTITALFISGCSSQKKIDLSLTEVSVSGYNTKGTLTAYPVMVDNAGMRETLSDLYETLRSLPYDHKDVQKYQNKIDIIEDLMFSLKCTWDKEDETYSNGDEAIYSCTFDKEAAKKAGYTYINTDIKYTVTGLPEIQQIDLFEGLSFEWDLDTINNYDGASIKVINNSPYEWVRNTVYFATSVDGVDAAGNIIMVASYDVFDAEELGYEIIGDTQKSVQVGKAPIKITEYIAQDSIDAAKVAGKNYLDNLLTSCDSSFSYKGNTVKIKSFEFVKFRYSGWSTSVANGVYNLKADDNEIYPVTFPLSLARLSDDSILDLTKTGSSCELTQKGSSSYSFTYWD